MAVKSGKTGRNEKVLVDLGALRGRAERRLRKGWEDAVEMLPPAPRKALRRLSADVERTRLEWRKRQDRMMGDARKRARGLAEEARKGVMKSLDPWRKRLERSVEPLQKRLEKSIEPLIARLDVASRKDIDRLQRRVQLLERRVHSRGHHTTPSA